MYQALLTPHGRPYPFGGVDEGMGQRRRGRGARVGAGMGVGTVVNI